MYDLGAEVGEQLAGERAGEGVREIEDPQPGERPVRQRLGVRHASPFPAPIPDPASGN